MDLPALTPTKTRLGCLDWMRGLAAGIMLQGHVLDGWLRPHERSGEWFWLSQFLGGMPAPIFLFLVGVSLALVLDKMRSRNASSGAIFGKVVRRAGWILLLAYAFRLEQYLAWYPGAQWEGVFKIDTLNCIGASTLLIGLVSIPFRGRRLNAAMTAGLAALIVALTPFLYVWRVSASSFWQAYFNGNGNPGYVSVVPWIAFALCGIAFGFMLNESREQGTEGKLFRAIGVFGVLAYALGAGLNLSPVFEYGWFDYSLTSPHFFLVRLGYLLLILYGAYRWSLRSTVSRWSPLRTMGQASLLVYWLHIEIVYGRPFHLLGFTRALTLQQCVMHLLWIVPAMLLTAWLRLNWSGFSSMRAPGGYFSGFPDHTPENARQHFLGQSSTDRHPSVQ